MPLTIKDLTFDDKCYIALNRQGLNNTDISLRLGVSVSLVARTRKNPRKSSTVREHLKKIIEKEGLPC